MLQRVRHYEEPGHGLPAEFRGDLPGGTRAKWVTAPILADKQPGTRGLNIDILCPLPSIYQ